MLPEAKPITSLDVNHESGLIVTSTGHDHIHLWKADALEAPLNKVQVAPTGGTIVKAQFGPYGRHIATQNGNGTVYIFRLGQN
ncbi:MAG: hypothetical protein CMJ78_22430 [Planctomycetaceae bacterium]|nr:hypothetical protein [Planctomycetaceae bacterium]